jgi:hypothetical protein
MARDMPRRKSILLRLDPAVHDALTRWAGDELRSTNAQIEFVLRRALSDAGRSTGKAPVRSASSSQVVREGSSADEDLMVT